MRLFFQLNRYYRLPCVADLNKLAKLSKSSKICRQKCSSNPSWGMGLSCLSFSRLVSTAKTRRSTPITKPERFVAKPYAWTGVAARPCVDQQTCEAVDILDVESYVVT